MYELIISEKPKSALKIAQALADGKPVKKNYKKVPYYLITHKNKDVVVIGAVGHLYGLAEKEKSYKFPVFDIKWKPTADMSKGADYSKKYLEAIKNVSKDASSFTVATDYDIEGEVIGLNIVKYVCKQKDAARMKFSTLTKSDLINSYENKKKNIDWPQAQAGETRHFLDWYNGINYSRALTSAYKTTGGFKILSIGRVQGPALKIIVDREKEIKAFKSVPFWQIELNGTVNKSDITAWHIKDKFWDKKKADEVMKNVKGKKQGSVSKIEKKQFKQLPPFPFDLTALQVEAYRVFKIQPKETLSIAQELYTSGYISYPRTSSNQLPVKIGYPKIISLLKKQDKYKELCAKLLKTKLNPNNGKKTDPAHPAIYPTGIVPELEERTAKIYDLITRRFMATFGKDALRETMKINIDVNKEIFVAKGTRTVEKGWFIYYGDYVRLEEEELPKVKEKDIVNIKKITLHDKETQPPKHYTPASIIKALEFRGLGTKSTRASIIDTLFQRHYVHGHKSIEATSLGINTIGTLEKFVPKIIDEALTRHFEQEMEEIREGKKKKSIVLEEAKEDIIKVIKDFRKHEKEVGESLKKAHWQAKETMNLIGNCPNCKEGNLTMRRGKHGSFASCSSYPKCKTIISLPSNALLKSANKTCETCGYPMVTAIKKRKRPQDFCINPKCTSKHVEGKAGKEAKAVAKGELEKPCPKCKKGKLVLRKSIYGSFYGCSLFPKCRHTEHIKNKRSNYKHL